MTRRLRFGVAAAALALLAFAAWHAGLLHGGLLELLPAVLIALPLLGDHYPGLARLAPRRRVAAPPARFEPPPLRPKARLAPRGAVLLAHRLAGRAPPGRRSSRDTVNPLHPRSSMRKRLALAIAASALAFPAAAQAHVTVQPNTAAAGSFTVFDVRVPNEEDAANTTKVDVQFPPGFAEVSYQPVPGWKVRVIKGKLAKPVKTDDGLVTDEVRRMIWTGGKIAPGQFTDFPISVQVPGKNGQSLTFKALQTYSNGKVVRWIGPESSDTPAPTVKLAAAATPAATKPVAATTSSSSSDSGDSASKGLGIAALIVGVLGLLAGLAALLTSRRRASGS